MDSDPDPAIFVIDLQDGNKKIILWEKFSAYYFLKVHLHIFSKMQGFSYFYVWWQKDPIQSWIRIQEAQKHMDPDPQHFFLGCFFQKLQI